MAWASGQSITSGSIATNLSRLFVFGSTDGYKDLVSSTSFTGSLSGTAAFGSDAIGSYVESFATGDKLTTSSINDVVSDSDYSWFVTFSRSGTVSNFGGIVNQLESSGGAFHSSQVESPPTTTRIYYNNSYSALSNDLSGITANTEFTVVITKTGTSGKYFYKSGSSPVTFTTGTFTGNKTLIGLEIGGWTGGGVFYPGRFRAYGRWSRALSDAEAQSMANTPQQILATAYTYARPASDITTQWTPSTGTSHYALINEVTASDADYIFATAAGQTDEIKLGAMTVPQAGTDVTINYRVSSVLSASVTVSLRQGASTLIKTDTTRSSAGTYAMTVTSAEWASVTDWTDLRLRFVSA